MPGGGDATGIRQVEARDTAQHPTMHSEPRPTENYQVPNINSLEAEKRHSLGKQQRVNKVSQSTKGETGRWEGLWRKSQAGPGCQDDNGGGEKRPDLLKVLRGAGEEARSQR